tara:strand:+ start:2998 stop:3714 length:717 start_codon:yes stop_codon:yes gene_type:complete
MALRLLPFRQYAEQDVINMFALQSDDILAKTNSQGNGDQGVFVKVTEGGLDGGPTTYDDTYKNYLGMDPANVPYVGKDQYPRVITEVGVANSGDNAIGVTLYQTAKADENDQKLLYYPQKKLEQQAVLPGESVPVLSRGIITVSATAGTANGNNGIDLSSEIAAGTDVIGAGVGLIDDGKLAITTNDIGVADGQFGTILATGSRSIGADQNADQFIGNAPGTGHYAIVQFDTNLINGS